VALKERSEITQNNSLKGLLWKAVHSKRKKWRKREGMFWATGQMDTGDWCHYRGGRIHI